MRTGDDPFQDEVDFIFKSRVEQRAHKDACADCFTVLTLKNLTDILTGRGFYLSKGKQKTDHLFTLSVAHRHSMKFNFFSYLIINSI